MATHDLWRTPAYVVRAMMRVIPVAEHVREKQRWLEPSAGDGEMVKGLIRAGVEPGQITAVEYIGQFADMITETYVGVKAYRADFLEWSLTVQAEGRCDYLGVANPPFGGTQVLEHIAAMKQVCSEFWVLAPAGLLEPCQNRGETMNGLAIVYPCNLRKFEDMHGRKNSSGSRPAFLYYYERSAGGYWPSVKSPNFARVFMDFHEAMLAEAAKEGDSCSA